MLISLANPNNLISEKNPEAKETQTIYIEYCQNCDSHLLTVRHAEHKYVEHFQRVKVHLGDRGVLVKKRATPVELSKQSPYCPPNVYYTDTGDIVHYPRIGSFEVYLGEIQIFSKLESKKWPSPQLIESLLRQSQGLNHKDNDIILSEQPKAQKEEFSSRQAKTIGGYASKSFHLRWQKRESDNQRYSLSRRNLLVKRERQNKTARSVHISVEKKIEQKQEAQIIKLYSPVVKKEYGVKVELENMPTNQGRARARKANVYLEPIYPKTRVSFQNYQKNKMIFTQRIHQQKIAFDMQKMRRQAEEALKFREKPKPRIVHQTVLHKIRESTEEVEPKLHVIHQKNDKKKECDEINIKNKQNAMLNSLQLPKEKEEQGEWKSYKKSIQNSEKEYVVKQGDSEREEKQIGKRQIFKQVQHSEEVSQQVKEEENQGGVAGYVSKQVIAEKAREGQVKCHKEQEKQPKQRKQKNQVGQQQSKQQIKKGEKIEMTKEAPSEQLKPLQFGLKVKENSEEGEDEEDYQQGFQVPEESKKKVPSQQNAKHNIIAVQGKVQKREDLPIQSKNNIQPQNIHKADDEEQEKYQKDQFQGEGEGCIEGEQSHQVRDP